VLGGGFIKSATAKRAQRKKRGAPQPLLDRGLRG
jgi:hypothetical protein